MYQNCFTLLRKELCHKAKYSVTMTDYSKRAVKAKYKDLECLKTCNSRQTNGTI